MRHRYLRSLTFLCPTILMLAACDDAVLSVDSDAVDWGDSSGAGEPLAPAPEGPGLGPDQVRDDHESEPVAFCPSVPTPTSEKAWKINQKGYLDTNVNFSSFFNGPHTVMGWVMPEFTFNEAGPIFAENGGGMYVVGQGDYREGTGGFLQTGDPVLHVSIGGKSVNYLAPGYKKREWNHIALVRTAADANGNYQFKLYVNATLLTPMQIVEVNGEKQVQNVDEIWFGPTSPMPANMTPQGALRLGRRTSGLNTESSKSWQLYGLVDEVAVYNTAMTAGEVSFTRLCGFSGNETTMVAGLTFDSYSSADPAGTKIVAPITPVAPVSSFVKSVGVATGYKPSSVSDAGHFDAAFTVSPSQVSYQLPFPAGEEWRVVQGLDSPSGSHNGYAAFCWDFARVSGSAALAQVTAAVSGSIVEVIDTDNPPTEQEGNKVRIKAAENELLLYLHQEPGSFEEVFMDGSPLLFLPQLGEQFWLGVTKGEALAKTGANAQHLHLSASDGTLTFPIAFTGYEVKDTSVNPPVWLPVLRGQPKSGQIIRRQ
ncbi:hypothetical protein [Nannocystis radixulma]|uniref:Concanavalin A-like lectin/glucanases superfamily protein n=1 Tax=Nannocystis radixulma TaxID=2995305 RepID=A0ABT5AZA6_9BACT|nr:hypothetical protein [Nannocystis radixulma]MDC0666156.1 hypothetical protein [Nannocystis radixulma]